MKIGIIGGGSWATALAKILKDNNVYFNWWLRDELQVQHLLETGHNNKYLTSVDFSKGNFMASSDLNKVVHKSDILIVATPSAFIHSVFADVILEGKRIISAVKGIVPKYNEVPADYFKNHHNVALDSFGIICGPCHAEEVAMERLSYLTVASPNDELAHFMSESLDGRYIRCNTSNDVIGTEISAVLKNVYAIAVGISHGLGFGDNYIAVLVSNAIQEISYFTDKLYPTERDVKSSAYLGDLLVTAYSLHSRNRRFGNLIGKGYSLNAVKQEMNMVAEGYYASDCIQQICDEKQIELPIAKIVYEILYKGLKPSEGFKKLSQTLK